MKTLHRMIVGDGAIATGVFDESRVNGGHYFFTRSNEVTRYRVVISGRQTTVNGG